jgi:predicted hotdog family 3-hydroxylacyl-ACP dehydratase
MSALIERADILRLVPQQGTMCLLECILDWDAQQLRARGSDPGAPTHPLRSHERLGSAAALEYAAQAAAAHGALLGALAAADPAHARRTALLASGRGLTLLGLRLDACSQALIVEVRRLHAEGGGALYEFELSAGAPLARGRLSLLLA